MGKHFCCTESRMLFPGSVVVHRSLERHDGFWSLMKNLCLLSYSDSSDKTFGTRQEMGRQRKREDEPWCQTRRATARVNTFHRSGSAKNGGTRFIASHGVGGGSN